MHGALFWLHSYQLKVRDAGYNRPWTARCRLAYGLQSLQKPEGRIALPYGGFQTRDSASVTLAAAQNVVFDHTKVHTTRRSTS